MSMPLEQLKGVAFPEAPALHSSWLQAEEELARRGPPASQNLSPIERQPIYAQECRDLLAKITAPGARDHALSQGIESRYFTVASSVDSFPIPVLQLEKTEYQDHEPEAIIIYYHGGGLRVGEADSEELSCRRILKSLPGRVRLYSIGYRLMPKYPASICVSDSWDGFAAVRSDTIKNIVIGSSSGGQLAASVAQRFTKASIHGLLLRCPVTCDATEDKRYLPEWLRPYHTSRSPSFLSSIFPYLNREAPRDGLDALPLEATKQELANYPRTWIQLCTNDTLYSDGLCHAIALKEAGVDIRVDLRKGWPHTFWLKTPQLNEALEAEMTMVEGLNWLLDTNGES